MYTCITLLYGCFLSFLALKPQEALTFFSLTKRVLLLVEYFLRVCFSLEMR